MPHILQRITLEQVRAARPEKIYYGMRTLWWTHDPRDICRQKRNTLPCDPRGGPLLETAAVDDFLGQAEANAPFYGKHGLAAFIGAHAWNCVVSAHDRRSMCVVTWQEMNDLLDRQAAEKTSWQVWEGIMDRVAHSREGRAEALADILRERQHQIERGHTPEADARQILGDLSRAATACLVAADDAGQHGAMFAQYFWPFHWEGLPSPRHGRRRLLVKAAALILAELERLPRDAFPAAAPLLLADREGGQS